MAAGLISAAHVRAIVTAGAIIETPEMRAEFEQDVLPIACAQSATRLTPLAKRRAEWYAETTFEQRHRRAVEDRAVWVTDLDDGVAELRALLPAVVAHGIHDRLSEMARTVIDARRGETGTDTDPSGCGGDGPANAADARTTDQIRADIFGDLLLTAAPTAHDGGPTDLGAIRATVQITVPVMSLIEKRITDPYETAFLVGHSPIDPQTACMLTAGAAGWDRILTHPISGQVLAVDRYRPNHDQRRHLTVRDQHCRFPGCRMPAKRCDIDHTLAHAHGGVTCDRNLAHLCEGHHTLKHNTAWTVRQHPGGVLEWTSPTGRTYTDTPISTIEFAPDPEHEIPDDPIPTTAMRTPEELDPDDIEFDELQFDPLELIPF
ncbi:HNH endonuclease signature motif containing protein [Microbacterium sp. CJ77]|uniref:HNH endonuclease signature motif containing protein n=1 Tax=Microbacterium sp. CJ77 TaxID=2079201 RepID=UPI0015E15E14|nr:HNH endonuclease signature motif containing protein [Microbacterium sp. CJ77]